MAMFRKTEDEAAPAVADLLETVDDDVKVCVCVCVCLLQFDRFQHRLADLHLL